MSCKTLYMTKSIRVHISLYKLWFTEANTRFDYLEISLIFHDKRDAHKTIYDSYDLELASTLIQNFKLGNASNKHSLSNNIEFDFENDFDFDNDYKQFVAYNWKGSSLFPLIDYVYNKVIQELTTKEDYLKDSDVKFMLI